MSFHGVHHAYGRTPSLRGIDLEIAPGEVICLLGPSGCGKSTLLRLAAGLDSVTAGEIFINRRLVSSTDSTIPPEKRGVGLMFQDYALFPHLSILANVMFGLKGLPRADAEREALNALARVGLAAYASNYPHALSGGEQQRVALARAIVPRPSVLLMDEPFSGLDKRLRDSVRDETLSVLRETRATSVLVTHDPEEAMRMADRIVLMRKGKIVQTGSAHDLYNNPIDIEAARFFSEVNELSTVVENGAAVTPFGRYEAPGIPDGAQATVCIRQQGIEILPNDPRERRGQYATIEGRILSRRFLGEVDVVDLVVNGIDQQLTARVRGLSSENVGNDVRVRVRPSDVLVFAGKAL
ncbi:MAG: ABC transporter ATP-binding protein [Tepidamorphaceae bacterium]